MNKLLKEKGQARKAYFNSISKILECIVLDRLTVILEFGDGTKRVWSKLEKGKSDEFYYEDYNRAQILQVCEVKDIIESGKYFIVKL